LFDRICLSDGLEALELMEGAVEGALDAGFVAAEGIEDAGGGTGVLAEEVGQFLVGVKVGVIGFEVLPVVDEAELGVAAIWRLRGWAIEEYE
jgi:hypothetical protein